MQHPPTRPKIIPPEKKASVDHVNFLPDPDPSNCRRFDARFKTQIGTGQFINRGEVARLHLNGTDQETNRRGSSDHPLSARFKAGNDQPQGIGVTDHSNRFGKRGKTGVLFMKIINATPVDHSKRPELIANFVIPSSPSKFFNAMPCEALSFPLRT